MRSFVLSLILFSSTSTIIAQSKYEPSAESLFGKLNPEAPAQVGDYEELIGVSECHSINRNPDLTWQDTFSHSESLVRWTLRF